jgi:tyrosine-protein phosphatase SIW14
MPPAMSPPRRLLSILPVALLLGCAGDPPLLTTTGKPFARRIEGKAGLSNLALVAPGIYRGAQPTAEGFRTLREMGIRTVICFRMHHSSRKAAEAAGLACIELPVEADLLGSEPPTREQVEVFLRIVRDPGNRPVFFHCAKGKDRTGVMAALYRIEVDGWTNAEAIEEMQAFGYHDYYVDLIRFVETYRPRGSGMGEG